MARVTPSQIVDRRVRLSDGREGLVLRAIPKGPRQIAEISLVLDDGTIALAFAEQHPDAPKVPFIVTIPSAAAAPTAPGTRR